MTERPILFSGAMVRAILQSQKQQTRRVLRDQNPVDLGACMYGAHLSRRAVHDHGKLVGTRLAPVHCPYGVPGDRLWVRENGWERPERTPRMMREGADTWSPYYFDADGLTDTDQDQFKAWGFKRRPSIHMPRWACRMVLEVTGVRVERLQDISHDDACAEGIENTRGGKAACVARYRQLWDSLNADRGYGWANNPFVWVVSFRLAAA